LVLVGAKEKLKHLNNYAALEAQVVALEVGVVTGTTGEGWAREYLRSAGGIVRFKTAAEALQALKSFKIDIMVHDGVSILMLQATSGGSGLKMIPMFFTEEYLAWGLRKSDDTLLKSTNSFLEQIKRDGTLKQILSKWIPNIIDLQ